MAYQIKYVYFTANGSPPICGVVLQNNEDLLHIWNFHIHANNLKYVTS